MHSFFVVWKKKKLLASLVPKKWEYCVGLAVKVKWFFVVRQR